MLQVCVSRRISVLFGSKLFDWMRLKDDPRDILGQWLEGQMVLQSHPPMAVNNVFDPGRA